MPQWCTRACLLSSASTLPYRVLLVLIKTTYTPLGKPVARLCQTACKTGYRTNHSLCATRLYQCGVEEQLIMKRTGHCSLEGVRSYKRTSAAQLSDILNKTEEPLHTMSSSPSLNWAHQSMQSATRSNHLLKDSLFRRYHSTTAMSPSMLGHRLHPPLAHLRKQDEWWLRMTRTLLYNPRYFLSLDISLISCLGSQIHNSTQHDSGTGDNIYLRSFHNKYKHLVIVSIVD